MDAPLAISTTLQLARRHRQAVCAGAIVIAIIAHRLAIWLMFGSILDHASQANPGWLTWQYLLLPAYQREFFKSLWYLQQTPPLPHVVFGLVVAIADWPVGVARCLYALQAGLTASSAAVLFYLLCRLRCGLGISAAMALVFGLSTDLVVLEVNSFGQLFYESGAMLFGLLACYMLCVAMDEAPGRRSRRNLVLAGLCTALGALTRSSFSLLALPLALIVVWTRGVRAALLFLAPVLLLQGGWCLKTYIVYGYASPATSTWAGLSMMRGLFGTPQAWNDFLADISEEGSSSAPWFVKLLREKGPVLWHPPLASQYIPAADQNREQQIQAALGGTNRSENSIGTQMLSQEYMKALKAHAYKYSGEIFNKFISANIIYWRSIADYSKTSMGPLYVEPLPDSLASLTFNWPKTAAFAVTGTAADKRPIQINLPTIPLFAFDAFCFIVLHIGLPLILLADFALRLARRPALLDAKLLVLMAVVGYGSVVFNLVEIGENMRFRLSVEPEIIALSLGLVAACVHRIRLARGAARQRR